MNKKRVKCEKRGQGEPEEEGRRKRKRSEDRKLLRR